MITSAAVQLTQQVSTVNPALLIFAGSAAGGALFRALNPDRRAELLDQVIADRRAFTERIRRISRGDFSSQERNLIEKGNEPTLNRLSVSAASRGVTGPAREQILAKARQAPYLALQSRALLEEGSALAGEQLAIEALPDDTGQQFFENLSRTSNAFEVIRQLTGGTNGGGASEALARLDPDGLLDQAVSVLYEAQGFEVA